MRTRKNKERIQNCVLCSMEYKTTSNKSVYCSTKCLSRVVYDKNMLDHVWRLKSALAAAKYRARTKNVPIDIDLDYLCNLWDEQSGRCILTRRPFDLTRVGAYGQPNPNTPSIDRIIPSKGYVVGNVRLIVYHINIALSDFGDEQFSQLALDYINTQRGLC